MKTEFENRLIEAGLREAGGVLTPPDLRDAVAGTTGIDMGAAGGAANEGNAGTSPTRHWYRHYALVAAAASVVVGLGLIVWEHARDERQGPLETVIPYRSGYPEDALARPEPAVVKIEAAPNEPELVNVGIGSDEALAGFIERLDEYRGKSLRISGSGRFGRANVTDAMLERLANAAAALDVRELDLSDADGSFTDAGFKHIAVFKSLRKLDISGSQQLSDTALETIGQLSGLRVLDLSWKEEFTAAGFAQLKTLTDLEELDASTTFMTDEGARAIASLRSLRKLSIGTSRIFVERDGPMGQPHPGGLPNRIGDEGVKALAALPKLESLSLWGLSDITGEGFRAFARTNQAVLTALDLSFCHGLSTSSLREIKNFPGLRRLSLDECPLDADVIAAIADDLNEIESLSLHSCFTLTDDMVAPLAKSRALKSLSIGGLGRFGEQRGGLTNETLRHLSGISSLESLWLTGCPKIDDEGFRLLATSPGLKEVSINWNASITDDGVRALMALSKLESIQLQYCDRVSAKVRDILKTKPSLKDIDLRLVSPEPEDDKKDDSQPQPPAPGSPERKE